MEQKQKELEKVRQQQDEQLAKERRHFEEEARASLEEANAQQSDLESTQIQLRQLLDNQTQQPVPVAATYLDIIKTTDKLGEGFYGVVYSGFAPVLGTQFAVKAVDFSSPCSRN